MSEELVPLKYQRGQLEVLNQLLLPQEKEWGVIRSLEDGWDAIRQMKVRGAPAIAIVAALTVAVELHRRQSMFSTVSDVMEFMQSSWQYLCTSRPTAVNLFRASSELLDLARVLTSTATDAAAMVTTLIEAMEAMLVKDVADNRSIGAHGAEAILSSVPSSAGAVVLTHCNTGSLATAGYGTALGVVRALHSQGRLERCYCTETRPYLQGARLTAYELSVEGMPGTLIPDSAAASLMSGRRVSAVVVGADRVAANGDAANKIGTYQLAVAARYHGVAFYVAAPLTTVDLVLESGAEIEIEERPAAELREVRGVHVAPDAIDCWNPAFDVTPAALIDGIVTEHGVFKPHDLRSEVARILGKSPS